MQQDIFIVGVFFPAIPLMIVKFGNRCTVLANLIRKSHNEVIRDNMSPQDAERFPLQINRLRNRLRLIGIFQPCAAMAFVLALMPMIAAYFEEYPFASMLFICSIILLILSMLLLTREIHIANTALDVHFSDLEEHQERGQYLRPKRRRREKMDKKA